MPPLTSRERVARVLAGELPDRVPVLMQNFQNTAYLAGMTLHEFCRSGAAHGRGAACRLGTLRLRRDRPGERNRGVGRGVRLRGRVPGTRATARGPPRAAQPGCVGPAPDGGPRTGRDAPRAAGRHTAGAGWADRPRQRQGRGRSGTLRPGRAAAGSGAVPDGADAAGAARGRTSAAGVLLRTGAALRPGPGRGRRRLHCHRRLHRRSGCLLAAHLPPVCAPLRGPVGGRSCRARGAAGPPHLRQYHSDHGRHRHHRRDDDRVRLQGRHGALPCGGSRTSRWWATWIRAA